MHSRVSVAELIDNDIPLRPDEAVAIVRDVCRQYTAGDLHGIPNATVIRLTPDGAVVVEGPVSRDHSAVPAAAALLDDLLPSFHSANGFRVPGGLRLVLARATGALDLPPFTDADEFSSALERFGASDLSDVVRGLYRSWAAREREGDAPSKELTISDVRRARRATGLSLEDVSRASGLPAAKLRELEWGYVRNWTADARGRDELRRYAHASGLDESLVVSVAWPLISAETEHSDLTPGAATSVALVPVGPQALATIPMRQAPLSHRHHWAVAFAAAVLVAVAGLSMGWNRPPVVPLPPTVATPPAVSRPAPLAPHSTASLDGTVLPATYVRSAASDRPAQEPPPRARAGKPSRQTPPHARQKSRRSFLNRELFRIVIR